MTSIFDTIQPLENDLQIIFDRVKNHLLTQNQRAETNESRGCRYRTNDGLNPKGNPADLKCAVGCLITDENYHPDIEGASLYCNPQCITALKKSGIDCDDFRILFLLKDLQRLHDCNGVWHWKAGLANIAQTYSLKN